MTHMNTGISIGHAILAFVPLYFVLQIWLGAAWSGRWRIAALVPLVGFVPAAIRWETATTWAFLTRSPPGSDP
jgi:hypothetical protein